MKKVFITLLILSLIMVTGCSNSEGTGETAGTEPTEVPADTTEGTGEIEGIGTYEVAAETVFDTLLTLPENFKANAVSYESRWAYIENDTAWLPNQVSTIPVQRFIYYDKDGKAFNLYSEVVLEPLSDENKEALVHNSPSSEDVLQYIVDINNEISSENNENNLTPEDFAGIVFSIEEMDGTYFLVSTRFVPIRRLGEANPENALLAQNGAYYFLDESGKTIITVYDNNLPVSEIVYDLFAEDWVLGGIYEIDKLF